MSLVDYAIFSSVDGFGACDRGQLGGVTYYDYDAIGAFDGTNGLPGSVNSLSEFNAYVAALEAKTTEISSTGIGEALSDATGRYVMLGGIGADNLAADTSCSGLGTIWGRDGNDTLLGGSGDDVLAPGAGVLDSLDGGAGTNTLSFFDQAGSIQYALTQAGVAVLDGQGLLLADHFQNLIGSNFGDTLGGDRGANHIDGGGGADTLRGRGGNDVLVSDGDGDKLLGGGGRDRFEIDAFTQTKIGVISTVRAGDVVDLSGAASALGFFAFEAVTRFDHHAGEVMAVHHAATDRTVFSFDIDGDGKADHKLVVRGVDTSDFGRFDGVDLSHLNATTNHDHGGLVA